MRRPSVAAAALAALLSPFIVAVVAHVAGTSPEAVWSAAGYAIGLTFGAAVIVGVLAQLLRR